MEAAEEVRAIDARLKELHQAELSFTVSEKNLHDAEANHTTTLNRLNNAQAAVDEWMANKKKDASPDSDWRRSSK